jgi:hypothetical protein
VACFVPAAAFAQAEADDVAAYVPEDSIVAEDIESRRGLDGMLTVNGNVNLVQNDSVVGQVDGTSILFGLGIKAGLDWISGRHEFRNTLTIDEAWARTPVLDQFVKSNDIVALEALYNYFFFNWMGAFARVEFETALLPTEDVRAQEVTYVIAQSDGGSQTIANVNSLELSDSFEPFSMYQSGGLFAEPLQTDPISISARIGLGARETFANGVIVLSDDGETDVIEAKELSNVFQGGAEAFLGLRGRAYENRLTYDVGASVLVPFLNNDEQDRDALDLTRWGVTAAVNFSVLSWLGLSYKLRLLDDPQLLDEIQVQNNLLLTFSYSFIERSDPAGPTPSDVALEEEKAARQEAEKRAEEAEKRAAEAERRAAEAEAAAESAPQPTEPTEPTEPIEPSEPSEPEAPDTGSPAPDSSE